MYAMYDSQAATLTFYRVPYDHGAAMQAIRHSELPNAFADRLEQGQ